LKGYLIWIKSGACIEGEAPEETLNKFRLEWTKYAAGMEQKRFLTLIDTDGDLLIDAENISGVAINDVCREKIAGL